MIRRDASIRESPTHVVVVDVLLQRISFIVSELPKAGFIPKSDYHFLFT